MTVQTKRAFLRTGFLAMAGAALLKPSDVMALAAQPAKTLRFKSLHTGESTAATFWENGKLVPQALEEINKVLRDHRTGEVHAIDTNLLHMLYDSKKLMGEEGKTLQVISGYRSPKTNAKLAAQSGGVAKKSMHMQGKAIDIRMEGVSNSCLRDACLSLKRGGVGYYPNSGFVHVDTGRVRQWAGS